MSFLRIARESAVYTIATLLPPLAALVTLPIFTRYLSPEAYAVITLVTTFSAVVGVAASLQLQGAVLRYVTGYVAEGNERDARAFFGSVILVMTAALLAVFLALEWAGPFLVRTLFSRESLAYAPYFRLGVATLCVTVFYGAFQAVLRARRRVWAYVVVSMVAVVTGVGAKLFLVIWQGADIMGMLMGAFVGVAAAAMVAAAMEWRLLRPTMVVAHVRTALRYSVPLIPHAASTFVFMLSNRIILEHAVSLRDLGWFGVAASIAHVPLLIVDAFSMAYSPHFIASASRDARALVRETHDFLRLWWLGLLGIMVVAAVLAEDMARVLLGPEFYGAAMLIPVLSLAAVGRGLYNFSSSPLFLDATRAVPLVTITAGVVSLGLNLLLIPVFGVMGAAWATVAAHLFTAAMGQVCSRRFAKFTLRFPWSYLLATALGAIVLVAAMRATMLPWGMGARVVGTVAIVVGIVAVLAAYLRRKQARPSEEARVLVFDSLKGVSRRSVLARHRVGYVCYVLEPGMPLAGLFRSASDPLPPWVAALIRSGIVRVVSLQDLDSASIRQEVNDLAFKVEAPWQSLWEEQIRRDAALFSSWVSQNAAQSAYRKAALLSLCDLTRLHVLALRCTRALKTPLVFASPSVGRQTDRWLKHLRLDVAGVSFATTLPLGAWHWRLTHARFTLGVVCLLTLNACVPLRRSQNGYRVGVTIENPRKNLHPQARDLFYLADGRALATSDMVLYAEARLSKDARVFLRAKGYAWTWARFRLLPSVARCVPGVCWRACRDLARGTEWSARMHADTAYTIGQWGVLLHRAPCEAFITSYDILPRHTIRNGLLQKRGVRTWFVDPSINYEYLYMPADDPARTSRHPFWQEYRYDGMALWNEQTRAYHQSHRQQVGAYVVIGAIWSDLIEPWRATPSAEPVIAVFDSSFYRGYLYSDQEARKFFEDVLWLMEQMPEARWLFKPKKDWATMEGADALADIYGALANRDRVRILPSAWRPTALIGESDLVISYPFTSPTFEAMSAGVPAIYHDPDGRFSNTHMATVRGVYTSSRDALLSHARRYTGAHGRTQFIEVLIAAGAHTCLDPFRDGRARARLRALVFADAPSACDHLFL